VAAPCHVARIEGRGAYTKPPRHPPVLSRRSIFSVAWSEASSIRAPLWILTLAIVSASFVIGIAIAGTDNHLASRGLRPIQVSPQRGPVPIIPGTPDEVVSKIAVGLPLVANAHVEPVSIPSDDPANPPRTGLYVYYDLTVESTEGGWFTRAVWEGHILSSAVADEFAARGFTEVIGAMGTLVTPDGTRQRIGGSVARFGFRDQIFDALPANLTKSVAVRAAALGLRDVHTSIVRGLQDAVVIEATTDTPAEALRKLEQTGVLDGLLSGRVGRFEGAYLGLVDSSGEPVLGQGTAARGLTGVFWVRPGLGVDSGARGSLPGN
jgi:hypothetical protein